MRSVPALALAALTATLLPACVTDDPVELDELEATDELELDATDAPTAAVVNCPVTSTVVTRSLVVTDPTVLQRFGFGRVINRIRATAGVATGQTSVELFQRWMRTFDAGPGGCDRPGIDPEGYGLVCPRVPEAKLAAVDPFAAQSQVRFVPVGLFNRFDLAPATGAHCGEYRIVYAMQSTDPTIAGRGFIIFEGTLPNPDPAAGSAGCLPIARFWHNLGGDPNVTSRADKLERLYFTGTAIPGLRSVVHAQAYGLAVGASAAHTAGQIRTNFFVDFLEWQLREFQLRKTCANPANPATCRLAFEHVPVKTNPAEELVAGTHPRSAAFATALVANVPSLARADVSRVAMTIAPVFDEFESVSQRFDVDYQAVATPGLKAKLNARLDAIGSPLTATHILRRATTQTCAGCHQVSNAQPLGGGATWPNSLGFVHIDEGSNLSEALTTTFLPRRRAVLEGFINAHCDGQTTESSADDATTTIGGSPIGAPN